MPYYHVRITQKSNRSRDETKVDLSKEELDARVLEPYRLGRPLVINGKTIPVDDIERIRISRSEQRAPFYFPQIEAERRKSNIVFLHGPSREWEAAHLAEDVTDELIEGPPGHAKQEASEAPEETPSSSQSRTKVFVVHGRDEALKSDVELFLHKELGLEPIVLHREPDMGLTIIEKLEKHKDVAFALILLTPDDVALSADELRKPEDRRNPVGRARQNVVFEWGFFVGRLGREHVVCLYKEGVDLPSDVSGLLYKPVKNSLDEQKWALVKEFRQAGLDMRTEWAQ